MASELSLSERGFQARFTPSPSGFSAEFYAHCARGELRFQRCAQCGAWRHLPRWLCPQCASARWSWERSNRRGRLFSWTVTHQVLHPAFAADVPYVVAIAELQEGVRLVARLRGSRAGALALGAPVCVDFERVSDRVALPVFRLEAP